MSEKKFYLTTPIYYVNARPHIGHAYTTIVADVLARRHRLLGEDTFFLTGTDEHGQKIERSAAAAGIPPQQFADEVSKSFADLWKRMGITNDAYIRTTDAKHQRGVQKLFTELHKNGFIYLASYTGAYCVSDETFVDAPAGTPCPDCGRILETVTEENFFFKLSEFQLPLLNLIESGQLKIENDARRNEVLSFLRGNPTAGAPPSPRQDSPGETDPADSRQGGVSGSARPLSPELAHTAAGTPYLPGALKDLSVSRSSFTWGIPVPEPAASEAKQKHVIYVWLDALANYMTAIGYGSDTPADEAEFKKFWPADLHLVGKEIIRFHCVYWPAFLLAAKLPLPKAITAHGWLLFDNSKMSKSKGNIVRTETILDTFGTLCPPPLPTHTNSVILSEGAGHHPAPQSKDLPEKTPAAAAGTFSTTEPAVPTPHDRDLFASDVLRYFLLREIPFGQDGSFSFDAMITRYNADLANGYGNLVSRTLTMIATNFESGIPTPPKLQIAMASNTGDPDFPIRLGTGDIKAWFSQLPSQSGRWFLLSSFEAATHIAKLVAMTDGYLSTHVPWKLAKLPDEESRNKLAEVLYTAAEAIRIITALLYPILPYATARVWAQLGLGDIELAAKNGELKNLTWGGLQPGTKLGPLSPIFPRADKSLAETMLTMENENATPRPDSPLKSAATPAAAEPVAANTFDPAAPPRTGSLDEPSGTLSVAGSEAHTTHNGPPPSHTEAQASGPFASVASQAPITATSTDASPQITIDDFARVELRIAQIVVAERIPKADKLLRLEVDLGTFEGGAKRQILSGIAEWYAPEDLIGRRIIVITNLAPRKMRGLESHGMLLAGSEEGGKPYLATVPEGVPLGTRLK